MSAWAQRIGNRLHLSNCSFCPGQSLRAADLNYARIGGNNMGDLRISATARRVDTVPSSGTTPDNVYIVMRHNNIPLKPISGSQHKENESKMESLFTALLNCPLNCSSPRPCCLSLPLALACLFFPPLPLSPVVVCRLSSVQGNHSALQSPKSALTNSSQQWSAPYTPCFQQLLMLFAKDNFNWPWTVPIVSP